MICDFKKDPAKFFMLSAMHRSEFSTTANEHTTTVCPVVVIAHTLLLTGLLLFNMFLVYTIEK